jgi:hypothetical protein
MFKTLASSERMPEFTRPREWEIKPTTPRCNEAMKLKKADFDLTRGFLSASVRSTPVNTPLD